MSRGQTQFDAVRGAIRRQMPALVAIGCFVNLLLLVTSIYMLQIYDRVLSSGSLDTLLWLTLVALVAIAIYGVLEQSRRLILSRVAGHIDSELGAPVLRQAMVQRLARESSEAGIRDVSDFRNFYKGEAILAFFDAPWSVVFIAFVWLLHPALGMIVLGGSVVLFCATFLNDLLTRTRQKEAARSVRAANEAAIRYVEGGETILPLGMADGIFKRWKDWQDRAHAEQHALGETTTTILSFSRSLRMALQIMILGAGAFYVLAGELSAGAMIAASIIGARALGPIERLTAAWNAFVASRTAKGALSRIFASIEATPDAVELPRPMGRLEVRELTLLAPDTRTPLLQNVGFKLNPGEICAVIGPSGAGKSSLCRAIVGAWKSDAGSVRLDGADTYRWAQADLGRHIGYLPQKVELFPGTVADNIGRFREPDSAAIIRAAELAGASDLILRLPQGYETDVGPHADRISLGQRQRIGLARAVYDDPALVVLDEPNSNLDGAGDKALLQALTELKRRGTTVVLVSHRSEILKAVDKVLVLQDGKVMKFCDRDQMLRPVSEAPTENAEASPGKTGAVRLKKPVLRMSENNVKAAE